MEWKISRRHISTILRYIVFIAAGYDICFACFAWHETSSGKNISAIFSLVHIMMQWLLISKELLNIFKIRGPMLKSFLQLQKNDVRTKISFRYIKRKSVAQGFAFKCVSLCYNLLLLSKQQEEIMYYACFVTREDIRFHVSPEWFFWYFLLLMKNIIYQLIICAI